MPQLKALKLIGLQKQPKLKWISSHGLKAAASGPQHRTSSCVQVPTVVAQRAFIVQFGYPADTSTSCNASPLVNNHTWITGTVSLLSTRHPGNP
ncbi:hypothetical protein CHARACLAT_027568 [Characodon lateralis]|uniref:Uncharacterized protein n=1 Tax=Characodon lateralis TaxID=208331 RepID=A0ABU7ENX2_9TELE|nr:hypothetical protein [Characodon lateralis]